jgi:hypothetical protein
LCPARQETCSPWSTRPRVFCSSESPFPRAGEGWERGPS